jgi:hypothetical protein
MSNLSRNIGSSIGLMSENSSVGVSLGRNNTSSLGEATKHASDSIGNLGRTGLQTEMTYDDLPDDMTMDSSYPKTFEDFKKENPNFTNTGVNLTRN